MPKYEILLEVEGSKKVSIQLDAYDMDAAMDSAMDIAASDAEADNWIIYTSEVLDCKEIPEPAVYNDHFDAAVGDYTKE